MPISFIADYWNSRYWLRGRLWHRLAYL